MGRSEKPHTVRYEEIRMIGIMMPAVRLHHFRLETQRIFSAPNFVEQSVRFHVLNPFHVAGSLVPVDYKVYTIIN